jgi:hypothetical protein
MGDEGIAGLFRWVRYKVVFYNVLQRWEGVSSISPETYYSILNILLEMQMLDLSFV